MAGAFALAMIAPATTAFAQHGQRRHHDGDRARVSHQESNGQHMRRWRHPGNSRPGPAIPEPTGALAFGLGLLAIGTATRRRERR